jgi:multicomponent Na+:H+ antiporter subunit G
MNVFTSIGYIFLCFGVFLTTTAMLGLSRFDNIYTRVHIATINDMFGIPIAIFGTALLFLGLNDIFTAVKLCIGIVIWYIIAPISNYIVIKMIYFYNNEKLITIESKEK